MKTLLLKYGFWLLLPVFVLLVLNRHSRSKFNNYHSINWADASGYSVYLPATFIYNWQANLFPDSIDHKLGGGFILNFQTNKIETRYTYVVSLLQSPFWLCAHLYAKLTDPLLSNGYTKVYYRSVMFASIFYLILGLELIRKLLSTLYNYQTGFMVGLTLFTTTNLYYYAINSGGYSHIYSFFLSSAILYCFYFGTQVNSCNFNTRLLIGIVALFLHILARPTNGLILLALPFIASPGTFSIRFLVKHLPTLLTAVVLCIIFLLPQLWYWYYRSGAFVYYTYKSETFTNLTNPNILEFLFSFINGVFPYTPVFAFIILGGYWLYNQNKNLSISLALIFLLSVYLYSSWWNWTFGCGFGSRNMVDWYPVYSIALGMFIYKIIQNKGFRLYFPLIILIGFAFINIYTTYHYDDCYYGSEWDYKEFYRALTK